MEEIVCVATSQNPMRDMGGPAHRMHKTFFFFPLLSMARFDTLTRPTSASEAYEKDGPLDLSIQEFSELLSFHVRVSVQGILHDESQRGREVSPDAVGNRVRKDFLRLPYPDQVRKLRVYMQDVYKDDTVDD